MKVWKLSETAPEGMELCCDMHSRKMSEREKESVVRVEYNWNRGQTTDDSSDEDETAGKEYTDPKFRRRTGFAKWNKYYDGAKIRWEAPQNTNFVDNGLRSKPKVGLETDSIIQYL